MTRTSTTTGPRFEFTTEPVTGESYELHTVRVRTTAGQYRACGGYITRRDDHGWATSGRGQWWVGLCWSDQPEHGPYRTLASARKAIRTGQVLTPTLRRHGWSA